MNLEEISSYYTIQKSHISASLLAIPHVLIPLGFKSDVAKSHQHSAHGARVGGSVFISVTCLSHGYRHQVPFDIKNKNKYCGCLIGGSFKSLALMVFQRSLLASEGEQGSDSSKGSPNMFIFNKYIYNSSRTFSEKFLVTEDVDFFSICEYYD